MASLTIVRGLPGSGKSTLAKQLIKHVANSKHVEADMYFMRDGTYQFDVNKLGAAHSWCQKEVEDALFYKMEVVVSNTFTTPKELAPYLKMAELAGIVPNIIICQSNFGSIHNVPEETMDRMRARFQFSV